MKYCTHCGKEIDSQAVVCPYCGHSVNSNTGDNRVVSDTNSFGYGLLGFLIPIVGLILFCTMRKDTPLKAKSAGIGALVSAIIYVVGLIIGVAIYFSTIFGVMNETANAYTALCGLLPL